MNIPSQLQYTKEHEWVDIEDGIATFGITDWAQSELGDIVFVELPQVGDVLSMGESFGTIEAVKAVSDLYSPLSGKVTEVNPALESDPMVINSSPFDEGWMIKIEISDDSELNSLISSAAYGELTV